MLISVTMIHGSPLEVRIAQFKREAGELLGDPSRVATLEEKAQNYARMMSLNMK